MAEKRVGAYKGTDVSVERTQSAIRNLLEKYGASGLQFTEEMNRQLTLRFGYELERDAARHRYMVCIRAEVPPARTRDRYGYTLGEKSMATERRTNLMAAWRALYWALKSRLESIEYGIETFEEAFLSHFELPDGSTIAEVLLPQLREGRLALPEQT